MQQIQLADDVYNQAKRRADDAGFDSVDEYIATLLTDDDIADTPDLNHLFTPERISDLDRISEEVKAGGVTYTMEEVRQHLAQNRADWIRAHGE